MKNTKKKKSKCFICRRNFDNKDVIRSDEHVIPDALGGRYHTYNVCKECNSFLGQHIDAPLVNHHWAKLFRLVNKISGKKKIYPNPFGTEGKVKIEDEELKVNICIDKAGNIDIKLLPYLDKEHKRIIVDIQEKQKEYIINKFKKNME